MEADAKAVAIELQTVIQEAGEKEYNTVSSHGWLYQKSHMDVLTYHETDEDGSRINNMLTIHDDKVSVKRTGGPIRMQQIFRSQKLSENVLQHPHGNIHMETFTKAINYQALTEWRHGELTISYTLRLNGQDEREHQLNLTMRSKEEFE